MDEQKRLQSIAHSVTFSIKSGLSEYQVPGKMRYTYSSGLEDDTDTGNASGSHDLYCLTFEFDQNYQSHFLQNDEYYFTGYEQYHVLNLHTSSNTFLRDSYESNVINEQAEPCHRCGYVPLAWEGVSDSVYYVCYRCGFKRNYHSKD